MRKRKQRSYSNTIFYCCFNVDVNSISFFIFDASLQLILVESNMSIKMKKRIELTLIQLNFRETWRACCQFVRFFACSFVHSRRNRIHLNQIPINKYYMFCVWYVAIASCNGHVAYIVTLYFLIESLYHTRSLVQSPWKRFILSNIVFFVLSISNFHRFIRIWWHLTQMKMKLIKELNEINDWTIRAHKKYEILCVEFKALVAWNNEMESERVSERTSVNEICFRWNATRLFWLWLEMPLLLSSIFFDRLISTQINTVLVNWT